jgi:hypothetical protein
VPQGQARDGGGQQPDAPAEHGLSHEIIGGNCQSAQQGSHDPYRPWAPAQDSHGQGYQIDKQRLAAVVGLKENRPFAFQNAQGIQAVESFVVVEAGRCGSEIPEAQRRCYGDHQ